MDGATFLTPTNRVWSTTSAPSEEVLASRQSAHVEALSRSPARASDGLVKTVTAATASAVLAMGARPRRNAVKGRQCTRTAATPRFAPEAEAEDPSLTPMPLKSPDAGNTGSSSRSVVKRRRNLPRWAPGGRKAAEIMKADTGMGGELDTMTEETLAGDGRCYRVIFDLGIGIRKGPSIGAERTGVDLKMGEVFEIKTEVRRAGRSYYELLDGRGWAFDWTEIDGERVELVELAAQLYTVVFPDGVNGIGWSSDPTMRFASVQGFTNEGDALALTQAGVRQGDVLVMIDEDPVVGMPFGNVLERVWATAGRQPGSGTFYKVTTESVYGIGIRDAPDMDAPRTGEDLIRGTVFEVDEIVYVEDGPTYLHLADDRGWVFDTTPIDAENGSCIALKDVEPGCTLTMWRGEVSELAKTIGLKFKQDGNNGKPFTLTVLEEGQPIQRVPIAPGSNLRKALVSNGFQVYTDLTSVFNCNAQQLCGTCVLDVMEGGDNLTVMSLNEKTVMSVNPPSYRLCCNIDVYGDVAVRLRPKGLKYGGGTS
eukprot:TRINITY_DN90701_c0_g1_i1.p1 TRINITY_DN90701_c0_g1~~TRINITY_DN90701_c0_g1_i1.p1  ORF type:complete len:548 (+),score=88.22 TRINITY_DN90701_c0_g1_i1:33-1646(+)